MTLLDNFSFLIGNKLWSYSDLNVMIIISESNILNLEDVEHIVRNLGIVLREEHIEEWNSSIQSQVKEGSHNANIKITEVLGLHVDMTNV